MRAPLHLDLLSDDERFSSSPVRLRVMAPLISILSVLVTLVWWGLIALRINTAAGLRDTLKIEIDNLKPQHETILRLIAEEKEFSASLRQLAFYRNARLAFGDTFALLPEYVPENIQFTELRVLPPPPPPPPNPKKPELRNTNSLENVTARLIGRASGENASSSVNDLLLALRSPALTNLFRSAEIPKGAFRQDVARGGANRDTLLFEINCTCQPRRFE